MEKLTYPLPRLKADTRTLFSLYHNNYQVNTTDIRTAFNPMWRIKALTERFGPCGIGWKYGVHHNAINRMCLQEQMQRELMAKYGWSIQDFIRIFGKNYI